ncbi:MAG: hypothetical protein QF357_05140 [Dehalococcoidia bacterium]|nr:hypothetical protein [Dehalococcoidia bacterium]
MRSKWLDHGPTMTVRENPSGAYTVWFNSGGSEVVLRSETGILANAFIVAEMGVWHDLAVAVVGSRIVVSLDGLVLIDHVDPSETNLAGSVGMNVGGNGGHTYFDDVVVTSADVSDLPLVEVIPTATPTAAAGLVATAAPVATAPPPAATAAPAATTPPPVVTLGPGTPTPTATAEEAATAEAAGPTPTSAAAAATSTPTP